MGDVGVQSVTAGLVTEDAFGRDINKRPRTVKRYIAMGMRGVVKIGNTNWINPIKARQWFEDGMPPPEASPSRSRRRATATAPEPMRRRTQPASVE